MVVARILVLLAVLCPSVALAGDDPVDCPKLLKRYERLCPVPTPTPRATAKPTVAPLPCEPIGTKTFQVGVPRLFCFTAPAAPDVFVMIEATTPANAGCAYFQLELTEPTGRKTFVDGASYPMMGSSTPRVVGGKYYLSVLPQWISDGRGCDTYQMTVR